MLSIYVVGVRSCRMGNKFRIGSFKTVGEPRGVKMGLGNLRDKKQVLGAVWFNNLLCHQPCAQHCL